MVTEFDREVLSRLPLAEACLRLLDFVGADDFLDDLFARHRGRCYEHLISFPLLVHLVGDALLQHHGSGHQSFQRADEVGSLPASITAAYAKLGRVPLSLSRALLAESSARLQLVVPATAAPLPGSLEAFRILILDGKKIKHVAKRLKPLRQVKGHVLGGKLVVALEFNTGLALALDADPDGEVSDAPLVPGTLAQVRPLTPGPRLWLADRQFCDLNQPELLSQDGDHFVIRYNAKVHFHQDPQRPPQHGQDGRGRPFVQEWGWIGKPTDKRRRYVRRLTLYRPGEEDVILLTDLLDEKEYPAEDILEVYLRRWGIEQVFQKITEVFALGHLIGCRPEATVFQGAFCLLLYNVVQLVCGYLAEAQQRPVASISLEEVFSDVQRQVVALQEVVGPAKTVALLPAEASGAAGASAAGVVEGEDGAAAQSAEDDCAAAGATSAATEQEVGGRVDEPEAAARDTEAKRPGRQGAAAAAGRLAAKAERLRQRLRELLAEQWSARWLKAPAAKNKPPGQPGAERRDKEYLKGGHTSVFRLLNPDKYVKESKKVS